MTQKFNRVAFFRPDSKPPYQVTSTDPEERRRAIRFYKKVIDDVIDNKATDVPGYPNLQAFSADPEFSNYFHDKVTREWADRAMSWQGLSVGVTDDPRSRQHNERVFAEARRRLSLNQQPNIIFTLSGYRFFTHSSLISHEEVKDGKTVLCLRDNNNEEYQNAACGSYLYLNSEGQLVNMESYESVLGGVALAFNDERDAVNQMKSLYKKCTKEKGCRRE